MVQRRAGDQREDGDRHEDGRRGLLDARGDLRVESAGHRADHRRQERAGDHPGRRRGRAPSQQPAQRAHQHVVPLDVEPQREARAAHRAGRQLQRHAGVEGADGAVAPAGQQPQRQRDAQRDADGPGHGQRDVHGAGERVQVDQIPHAIRGAQRADQQHDHAHGDAAHVVSQPEVHRRDDEHLRHEGDDEVQDQRVVLPGAQPPAEERDQQRSQHRRHHVREIAVEEHAEARRRQDARQVVDPRPLGLARCRGLEARRQRLGVRRLGAGLPRQGVQTVQPRKVHRLVAHVANLRQPLALGGHHRRLDVARHHPDVAAPEAIAVAQAVEAVLHPVGLRPGLNHGHANIQNQPGDLFTFHSRVPRNFRISSGKTRLPSMSISGTSKKLQKATPAPFRHSERSEESHSLSL